MGREEKTLGFNCHVSELYVFEEYMLYLYFCGYLEKFYKKFVLVACLRVFLFVGSLLEMTA